MDALTTTNTPLQRHDIAEFIPSQRGVRAFEDLQNNSASYGDAINALIVQGNDLVAAPYVVTAPSLILTNESVLTGTVNISVSIGPGVAALDLTDTSVISGTYGSASETISVNVDAKGRLQNVTEYSLNTDNIAEGVTNLFYTNARARSALSGSTGITYTSATGVIALDTSNNRNVDHSSVSINAGTGLSGGGDITATRTLNLANTAVTPGIYGSVTSIPSFNVDAQGRLIAATGYTIPVLDSGAYNPTLTNVSNLDASTVYSCQYMRVGDTVTVSGKVDVDPTALAQYRLAISLPIASNLVNEQDCAGTGGTPVLNESGAIRGDTASNRAELSATALSTSNHSVFFNFTYRLL